MRLCIFIPLVIVLGCSESSTQEQNRIFEESAKVGSKIPNKQCFVYNKYNTFKNDSSVNPNFEICFNSDSIYVEFDNVFFKAKHLKENDGIYINNILTHSFSPDTTINIPDEVRLKPIINQTTKLVETKSYLLESKELKVLKYYENFGENSHSLIVSYYLENGIPLIICKYYSRSYISIENEKYLEIVQAVVQDDDYFEIDDLKPPTIE